MIAALPKSKIFTTIVFFGLFAAVVLALRVATGGSGISAGQMPTCVDPVVSDLLTTAINESPRGLQGLKVQRANNFRGFSDKPQSAYETDPTSKVRFCIADVFTNAGRGTVYFNLTWTDQKKNELSLLITTLPF
ncbi:MAG: hypothetical protein ACOY91_10605 [Pseudomonadota bacterium]